MNKKGMKVNISKTKVMVTGKKNSVIRSGRCPCGVCGRLVGQNSIQNSGATSGAQVYED